MMSDNSAARTEMWKALKWTVILLVALTIAIGLFKAWQVATAPARVVSDAAGSVKSSAAAIMSRLEVPIQNQRKFDKAANTAFFHLNEMSETTPEGVKDRGFRMTNLRGAQNKVCELSYDFGDGNVEVVLAADNSAYAPAKAVGAKSNRLIRIIVVSPEQTLGLNAEYDETSENWSLGWRPSSVKKPYPDSWAEMPLREILTAVPKTC